MTPTRPSNGIAMRILWWIVASLWAVVMAVSTMAYSRISTAIEKNTELTTVHEARITGINDTMKEIKDAVKENNTLIRDFLINRYGYSPK